MNNVLKWVLGVFGVILVGALGSGFWETLLKPLLIWASRLLLRAFLGIFHSSKDKMYIDAARGKCDRSAIYLLGLALFAVCYVIWYPVLKYHAIVSFDKEYHTMLASNMPPVVINENEHSIAHSLMIRLCLCGTFVTCAIIFSYIRLRYIESVVTLFNQWCEVCRPAFEPGEESHLRSRFAQMQGKQDFVGICAELTKISKKNSLPVPNFSIM